MMGALVSLCVVAADDSTNKMSHVGLLVVETPQAINAPPQYADMGIKIIAMHGGVCKSNV